MTVADPQHVSLEGAKFIACREALVTVAYQDGVHMSIGFGSNDPNLRAGDTITIEAAFERLLRDIRSRELAVNSVLEKQISQQAFDAMFSLYYQRGTAALNDIGHFFNIWDENFVAKRFLDWNSGQNGVETVGHTKRRIREAIMIVDGYYGDINQVLVFDGDPRKVKPKFIPFPNLEWE